MPFVETSYGRIFYAPGGTGTLPVVCLHGAGGTHQHWGLQLAALRSAMRICTLDLPGHGRSSGPGCRSVADYSAAVVAVLDALQDERVVLAGHSMGGGVALTTALNHPERVAGLVLVGTGAKLPVMPALFEHIEQGNLAAAVRLIVEGAYASSATPAMLAAGERAFMQTDPDVFYGDLLACAGYDVRDDLGSIQCPTLIICGDEDRITPPKFSALLHSRIGGSRLVVVPGAGHMVLVEHPAAVGDGVGEILYPIHSALQLRNST